MTEQPVSPTKLFRDAHKASDVDFEPSSQHHTLGKGPNNAAAGNHNHDNFTELSSFNPIFAVKTVDTPVTSSTVFVVDPDMRFNAIAGETYEFMWQLYVKPVSAAANGGIVVLPTINVGTGILSFGGLGPRLSTLTTGTFGSGEWLARPTVGSLTFGVSPDTTNPLMILVRGIYVCTGSGSVVLRWAQSTSNVNGTVLMANSYIKAQKVS